MIMSSLFAYGDKDMFKLGHLLLVEEKSDVLTHKGNTLRIKKKEVFSNEDLFLVIRMGFEPMTPTLKVLCSTN